MERSNSDAPTRQAPLIEFAALFSAAPKSDGQPSAAGDPPVAEAGEFAAVWAGSGRAEAMAAEGLLAKGGQTPASKTPAGKTPAGQADDLNLAPSVFEDNATGKTAKLPLAPDAPIPLPSADGSLPAAPKGTGGEASARVPAITRAAPQATAALADAATSPRAESVAAAPAKSDTPSAPDLAPRADRQNRADAALQQSAGRSIGAPAADRPQAVAPIAPTAAAEVKATPAQDAPLLMASGDWGTPSRAQSPAAAHLTAVPAQAQAHAQAAAAQIAEAISLRAQERSLTLRLDPPELGQVRIDMTFDQKGGVTAILAAEQPDTSQLLRRHTEWLQRELASAGFTEANISFGDGTDKGDGTTAPWQRLLLTRTEGPATGAPDTVALPASSLIPERIDLRL